MNKSNQQEIKILKKPSAMIQVHAKGLTFNQRKMINALVHLAQKVGVNDFYETNINTLKKLCNITSTENLELKTRLKELVDIKIEYNYLKKDKYNVWGTMSLLAEVFIDEETKKIQFSFPPSINKNVIEPLIYAPLDLLLIASLKSTYSIVLYEFLRDYINSPTIPLLTIEQLRELFGIENNKYQEFNNFKIRVLNVAVKEINSNTDIECKYKLKKESGNKYSHVQFLITKKKSKILEEIEKTVIEIEKTEQLTLPVREKSYFQKLSFFLDIKVEVLEDYIKTYGFERVKEVFEQTKKTSPQNPAGYFIKALSENYQFSSMAKIDDFRIKDSKNKKTLTCYDSLGNTPSCKITWERAQTEDRELCYSCPKFEEERLKQETNAANN